MPRLFVRHRANMEVHGCLGGDNEVNVIDVAFVDERTAVGSGLDGHVTRVDICRWVCKLGARNDC
jgi:hypothetical protein